MGYRKPTRYLRNVYGLAFIGDMTADVALEITNPRMLQGRTIDRIVWLREPTDDLREAALYATHHSRFKNKIVEMYD